MSESDVCQSFNSLQWHDSKLRSFAVKREGDVNYVVLDLELRGFSALELTPATLVLEDVTYLKADIDLDGKAQCSDDISSAGCSKGSPLKEELLRSHLKYTPTALDHYYLFDIYLIPPGGRMQVFARSFRLERK